VTDPVPTKTILDDVLRELNQRLRDDRHDDNKILSLLKHPAALVTLTFALTTGVGGCLASHWQQSEWEHEQRQLNNRRQIEVKYKIVDDLTAAVADTTTAAQEVLYLAYWDVPNRKVEMAERRKYWQTSSRTWRVSSKRLQVALATQFAKPIAESFDQLLQKRSDWGNDITGLLNASPTITAPLPGARATLDEVTATVLQLRELTSQMLVEVRRDEAQAAMTDTGRFRLFKP
jgi:hypothetical protein